MNRHPTDAKTSECGTNTLRFDVIARPDAANRNLLSSR